MNPEHAHHFFLLSVLVLVTIFAIAAMRTFAKTRSSRRDGLSLQTDLADVKTRLASVEAMLREVG